MIPNEALLAIGSVMLVGVVFGYVMHSIVNQDTKQKHRKRLNTIDRRTCDTCKYEFTNPNESPCKECADDVIDWWTPSDFYKCDTCRYSDLHNSESPCDLCVDGDKWETRNGRTK